MSVSEGVDLDSVIVFLNQLIQIDSQAVGNLVENRVLCNEKMADHPTVQVGVVKTDTGERFEVGILGVINGLFGIDEDGHGGITAIVDDTDGLIKFVRTTEVKE